MNEIKVTFSEFEQLSGIPSRTLYNWQKQGILPKSTARGRHELGGLIKAVLGHLASPKDEGDRLRAAKIRESQARARKLELEVSVAEGELVDAADVAKTWARTLSVFRGKLLGLPSSLADELEEITDKVIRREIIQNVIFETLEELASGDLQQAAKQTLEGDSLC